MLPEKICFVDVETTGGNPLRDRVMEIGILRVENSKLVKKFSSLINPQTHVPPFIVSMTGIDPAKLESAPTFYDLKDELLEILQDSVFIAHNVRFDYNFLRYEFKRYDLNFSSRHACTVKMFRKFFPQLPRHNLDAVISHFSIPCPHRHRAFDDAKVLWHFYKKIQTLVPVSELAAHIKSDSRHPTLPPHLPEGSLDKLPESPGVYIFYSQTGTPLYVGKSINVKDRVLSHFSTDASSVKEMTIKDQLHSLETIPTAGELGALLLESQLVKKLQPLYNRQLRYKRLLYLYLKSQINGFDTVEIVPADVITPDIFDQVLGIHKSASDAKRNLVDVAKQYQLCPRLLGLQKGKGACFSYHLEQCKGACIGKEEPLRYNLRFLQAFSATKLSSWPFPGPVVITETSPFFAGQEQILVNNWCLISSPDSVLEFDLDTYKILHRYLLDPRNQKYIKPISPSLIKEGD